MAGMFFYNVLDDFRYKITQRNKSIKILIAPQAQLLETAKSVGPEALFKQVVKFGQIDPLWSILGENKGGPYCRKFEIT